MGKRFFQKRTFVILAVAALAAIVMFFFFHGPLRHGRSNEPRPEMVVLSRVSIPVDYTASVDSTLRAGKYQSVNGYISDTSAFSICHCSCPPKPEEMVFVRFDKPMLSSDVVERLDVEGFRPADLHELLAFGATHPAVERASVVVGLGSVAEALNMAPYLYIDPEERTVALKDVGSKWNAGDLFIAIRK